MMEWQPIETAPKVAEPDSLSSMGPMIMLASSHGHIAIGYWGSGVDRVQGWINPNDHRRMDYWNEFEFWMPIPKRPTTTA